VWVLQGLGVGREDLQALQKNLPNFLHFGQLLEQDLQLGGLQEPVRAGGEPVLPLQPVEEPVLALLPDEEPVLPLQPDEEPVLPLQPDRGLVRQHFPDREGLPKAIHP